MCGKMTIVNVIASVYNFFIVTFHLRHVIIIDTD